MSSLPRPGAPARPPVVHGATAAAARRRRQWLLGLAVLALLLLAIVGPTAARYVQGSGKPTGTVATRDAGLAQVPVEDSQPLRFGKPGAAHILTIYEDVHCSHCVELEQQVGETIYSAVAAGTTRLEVWPLTFIDEGSGRAAAALGCAASRGYGLSYHELLFKNPLVNWTPEQLQQAAATVAGKDQPDFAGCVKGARYTGWAKSVTTQAQQNGITGTPTLVLDGAPLHYDDTLTPETLKAKLA